MGQVQENTVATEAEMRDSEVPRLDSTDALFDATALVQSFLDQHQHAGYEGLSASEHLSRITRYGNSYLTRWSARDGEGCAFRLIGRAIVSARYADQLPATCNDTLQVEATVEDCSKVPTAKYCLKGGGRLA